MSTAFEISVERVLKSEGGYVNHPADPGGETNWGIIKTTARTHGYQGQMRHLTREQAIEIYYQAFWLRYHCNKLPHAVAYQYFDACVNHGAENATKILQRALGVIADGVIGVKTLAAIAATEEMPLLLKFNQERLRFYTSLKTFGTFGKGWTNRVAMNLAYAAEDVA